jgi:hypothetical protein
MLSVTTPQRDHVSKKNSRAPYEQKKQIIFFKIHILRALPKTWALASISKKSEEKKQAWFWNMGSLRGLLEIWARACISSSRALRFVSLYLSVKNIISRNKTSLHTKYNISIKISIYFVPAGCFSISLYVTYNLSI